MRSNPIYSNNKFTNIQNYIRINYLFGLHVQSYIVILNLDIIELEASIH